MPRSQAIGQGIFAGAYQITCRFLFARGDSDLRQFSRAIKSGQFLGIAPIRLDPIAGPNRRQAWRDDYDPAPEVVELALHFISTRPRFVDKHRRAVLVSRFANRTMACA